MARVHDDHDGVVGLEEGKRFLPSHVLHEAFDKLTLGNCIPQQKHHQQQWVPKWRGERRSHKNNKYSKSASSSYYQPKYVNGGPGMQVIFIESEQKPTSGTGVFLPQRGDTKTSKKPAYAPVFLPAQLVQALNLDVYRLGLQASPQGLVYVPNYNTSCGEEYNNGSMKNKNDEKDDVKQCFAISQSESSCPEIISLPEEWTY